MTKVIDVFYQGDGIAVLEHIEVNDAETFGVLRALICERHGAAGDSVLFLEEEDGPVEDHVTVASKASRAGIKVHLHRCRKIKVTVHFKHKSVHDSFAPGATVARIKHWAAVRKFGMTEEEASHHHLQLTGTTDQPDPGTHVGTLTTFPKCAIEFDLVSTPKING